MNKFCFSLILILLFPSIMFSQSEVIYGFVYSRETNAPIQFASVFFEKTQEGTISNSDGLFSIKKPKNTQDITVSCIGYKTKIVNLTKLTGDSLIIGLLPEVYSLQEVSVTSLNALDVIKKAIASKPENYPIEPTVINGYYKQVTKQDGEYIRFSEADLSIYRHSYISDNKKKTDLMKVVNARSTKDKAEDIMYETFVLDEMLRVSKFELDTNYVKDYKLEVHISSDYNNRLTYMVSIRPIKDKGQLWANIYIDKESFAIVAIKLKKDIDTLQYSEKQSKRFKYKNKSTKFCIEKSFNYLVTYKKIDNKWHLNYIHANNEIVAFNNTDTTKFNDICDFLVSNVTTENIEKFHKSIKPQVDIYSIGITNKEIFDDPNKILDTKSEEIIKRRSFR